MKKWFLRAKDLVLMGDSHDELVEYCHLKGIRDFKIYRKVL